jgi:hypothetical protein
MLARNPKTGAPIRILRSDASLWRNKKTLVWLHEQDAAVPWDRWDTVCVGVSEIQAWKAKGKRVDCFLLDESNQEAIDFFLALNPQDYKLMFIPKALVLAIGIQRFRSLQISNVIVMEEAHLMYPFVGAEWDRSKEDGVLMIAAILRTGFVSGVSVEAARWAQFASLGVPLQRTTEVPMELWYITQYYKPEKARRAREIRKCLEQNLACPVIDKLVLLNEVDYSDELPKSDKIRQDVVVHRLTYKMVLEWVIQNVPDNVICIFGNADIYLDPDSWRDIWSVSLENVFLALLRWDVQEGDAPSKIFGPRNDSQDTWGFLSTSVKSKQWDLKGLEFPFGKAGCDNAITVEMLRKKFLIVNPALSLKTHHLQLSNLRSYDPQNVVDKPCYMYVDPTGIHDMEPVYDLAKYGFETMNYAGFERRVRGVKPKAIEVFCKMLERGERYLWKATGTNPMRADVLQLLRFTNCFQTPQGLAYAYNQIFVGKEEVSKEAWSKSELSPIHPSYESERCYAVPWDSSYDQCPERYVLSYLPKVLQLRKTYGSGEFFAPQSGSQAWLECFKWSEKEVPVLTHKPNVQVWCKELIQYPLLAKQEVRAEEIAILRESLQQPWESSPSGKRFVVMIDGKWITTDMVRAWEATHKEFDWSVLYESRTSPDRMTEKLRGASGLICAGGPSSVARWGLSWMLPHGASVIEIQNEMEPDGEAAHCSGAAGLVHSLVIVPRASEKVTQEMISKEVSETVRSLGSGSSVEGSKSTVYLPRKSLTGFFSHAGDSFREMVQLWAEKGYVDCVEDPKAVQIWLEGVGKTLLYDRPTLDWLFTAPPEEQTWELGLFGNPKPSDSGGPARSWFFWPRRPKLVEEVVAQGLPQTSWSERSKVLVFYGKIENKVQEKRRKAYDWSSVCDDYQMVSGESTPYKFTQKEYLENLTKAKFGLCLAGFGKKCHREVECMAMGCVPVVTMDVDMDSYANPPEEGVHYIRVAKPEEIEEKVKSLSEEKWAAMSAACTKWWRENASAEGSWILTQKLKGSP